MNRLYLGSVVPFALLLAATSASAQDGFDVQRFAPTLNGAHGFWSLPAGSTVERLQWGGSARLHFGTNPLVVETDSEEISVVSGQLQLDLSGFIGVTDWLEVSAGLPVVLAQSGDRAASVVGLRGPATGPGFGDGRIALRAQVLGPNHRVNANGLDISLAFEARLPLGDPERFQSDGGLRYQPSATAEYSLPSGIRAGLQLGYWSRPDVQVDSLEIKDEFTWGMTASFPIGDLRVIPEFVGGFPLGERQSSLEARGGVRYLVSDSWAVDLATGIGVVAGVGNAGWRLIGGLHFSRRSGDDRDGDGIPNAIDDCPNLAPDYGRDRDMDGCPDLDDDLPQEALAPPEPFELAESAEPIEELGITVTAEPVEARRQGFGSRAWARDTEGDGVSVADDRCPELPEWDADPFRDEDGCPTPDSGEDGFLAVTDLCGDEPETYNGLADSAGCPDDFEHVEVVCDFIFLLTPITFDGPSAVFSGESLEVLDEVAIVLGNTDATLVRVEAHTDSAGGVQQNVELTQNQAQAIVDYLEAVGVSVELMASGMGEQMPIAGNDTELGRAENRRIEFHLNGDCD